MKIQLLLGLLGSLFINGYALAEPDIRIEPIKNISGVYFMSEAEGCAVNGRGLGKLVGGHGTGKIYAIYLFPAKVVDQSVIVNYRLLSLNVVNSAKFKTDKLKPKEGRLFSLIDSLGSTMEQLEFRAIEQYYNAVRDEYDTSNKVLGFSEANDTFTIGSFSMYANPNKLISTNWDLLSKEQQGIISKFKNRNNTTEVVCDSATWVKKSALMF